MWIEIENAKKATNAAETSPSTRRVWIEIVAEIGVIDVLLSHPPHGGCGLKFYSACFNSRVGEVTLHTEGVD